ncbi:hypothetical protein B6U99_07055 [Candidatus Geothermarchaeota archaeon ex4572_27]|nr:MAG: hypothetical protein B6U99_07055 [Candidatus Geothermarchaeota archaeon ex4572_27]
MREVEGLRGRVQVCFYTAPLGVVPLELDEVYPASQHEKASTLALKAAEAVAVEVVPSLTAREGLDASPQGR